MQKGIIGSPWVAYDVAVAAVARLIEPARHPSLVRPTARACSTELIVPTGQARLHGDPA